MMSSTVITVSDQDDSACIKWHTLGVLSNQIPGPKSKKRRSRKWNKVDDKLLKKMVEKEVEIEGMDINTFQFGRVKHSFWTNISNGVNENKIESKHKSRDSCRMRWTQYLQHTDLREDCMSEEEIYLVLLAIERIKLRHSVDYETSNSLPNKTWEKLSLIFPGRSELDIKNAYHSFQRQKLVAHDLGDTLDKSKLRPEPSDGMLSLAIVGDDCNNSNKKSNGFWENDDETLWLNIVNAMEENDKLYEKYEKYVNKKRARMNEVKNNKRNNMVKKRKRQEQLLLNLAEGAINYFRNDVSDNNNTVNLDNEIDLDDLIRTQSLSNLKSYARTLGIQLKSTNKASTVEVICKAIYQNDNMLQKMMKLLNENSASDFSANEHTYTIIDEEKEQHISMHQSRIASGGSNVSISVSPNKRNCLNEIIT
jgi:hypothetical protein